MYYDHALFPKKKAVTVSHIALIFRFVPLNLEDWICFHLSQKWENFTNILLDRFESATIYN